MTEFFLEVVNMSISASWIVLAVLLFRFLLKKAPKWINVLLWGIVAVRLICPFSFESVLSLIPSSQTINPEIALNSPVIDSGVTIIDNVVNPIISETTLALQPEKDINFFQFIMPYLAGLWLAGIAALLIYTAVSFIRLKKKIGTAVILRDNIYQSENVISPFVLGIIKPKIYLPFNINGQDMEHVIAHEQAHIRRKDHLWKPLGFLVLTLHWFNPLVWLGYVLLCRDIELACDEKVVKELDSVQRADYSEALLTCSVNRKMIAACPLAFGEVGVKNRVKSVLNYKKPAFWIIVIAVIVSIATAVCFLTDPLKKSEIQNGIYSLSEELYSDGSADDIESRRIELKTRGGMHVYHFIDEVLSTGGLYKEVHSKKDLSALFSCSSEFSADENLKTLLKNNKDAWYDKPFDNIKTYPYILMSQKDGSLYMVFADFENGELTKIRYIRELDFAGNVDAKMFYWTYNPMLSFTGHSFYPFEFDLDYTYVIASCENGYMQNLEADGQPKDKSLQFTKGQNIYWTPDDAFIENIPEKSEVKFEVYNGDILIHRCSAVFERVGSDVASADFEIRIMADDGLAITYDDCITFYNYQNETVDIKQLKSKFPMYFNLNTEKGLEVYIWQMAEDSYSCGILPGKNMNYTNEELWNLHTSPASLDEMRAIVTSYLSEGLITKNDITVNAIVMPHSSYAYTVDSEYTQSLTELFWADILEVEPTTNSETIPFPLGSFENPYNIGDSARIKHGDINQKDVVYDYNASITRILTGKEAEERLKEIASNYEEEKEVLESFDLYLTRVHIKYNEESTVKDRLPTAFGVTAVSGDRQLQFIDPRFNITENSYITADGEYDGWFPVLASKDKDTCWLSITTGTYQGAPGIISGVCFAVPLEKNTTEFSGFSYIYRCDDTSHTENFGNGTISLPEFPASIKLKDCGFVRCDDGCEAEEIINRAIQGFARVYYMEADGELTGNHKILKFKMTVPEQMTESLQKQGVYEDTLAKLARNYYYLIPFGEAYYAYIHLEGEDEAFADSIVKNAEVLIALP